MGATNALRAYTAYGAVLGDHAMRALAFMALISRDGDAEPWFSMGWEAISELAYGTPVPAKETDPKGREAALKSVSRAITAMRRAGAIQTADRARYGSRQAQNARYRLYLDRPCAEGDLTPGRQLDAEPPSLAGPGDTKRPVDASRPVAPDPKRPRSRQTTGHKTSIHRTKNVYPQDAERPTKEKEEDEEREINQSSVVDRTVEGDPRRHVRHRDRSKNSSSARSPDPAPVPARSRPLIPYAIPDARENPESLTASCDPLVTAVVEAVRQRTGQTVTPGHARQVAAGVLGRHHAYDPVAYVRESILSDPDPAARFLPARHPPARQPWCGDPTCNPQTRMREPHDGAPRRCPACGTPAKRTAS